MQTSRREMLALAALGGAALASGPALARAAPRTPATPEEWLRAYMLMRGALDDRLTIGFITGTYYGVVDQEIRPLYGVVAATFARYRKRADGGYDGVTAELPYFVDLETGKVLDTFRNPYTEEDVAVVQSGYPPTHIIIGTDLRMRAPTPVPGLTLDDEITSREVIGGDVYIVEQTRSTFQAPGMPKPVRYSEMVTLQADAAALADRRALTVPTRSSYTSIVSWRPWLKMGDRPGNLVASGHGGYGAALDALPKRWRDAAAARRPDVLKDPGAMLPPF